MSELLKPKPAGLVQPRQLQDKIMHKFKEIMPDPECAKALCDQVIPLLPTAGPKRTLFLDSSVSEDPGTIAARSAEAALCVQAYQYQSYLQHQSWCQHQSWPGMTQTCPTPALPLDELRGPRRLEVFDPENARPMWSDFVVHHAWKKSVPGDPWWHLTMRPIAPKKVAFFKELLRKWEDVRDVWNFPEVEEVHVLVRSRISAYYLYACAKATELKVQSVACPPRDQPGATTTNSEPLEENQVAHYWLKKFLEEGKPSDTAPDMAPLAPLALPHPPYKGKNYARENCATVRTY